MDLSREKLESAFAKVITRNRDADPLTLAEKLADRLEFLMEDADGGDMMPVRLVGDGDGDPDNRLEPRRPAKPRATPLRPEISSPTPPAPNRGLILTPDDPEFAEAARLSQQARPPAARVSKLGQEQESTGDTEYWTIESMSKALQDGTPAEFYFVPNNCDESQKVRAVRNIQWQVNAVGPHMVKLEYKNPGVGDDRSTTDQSGQLGEVVIGLTATKLFNLGMPELDLKGAMDSILVQLEGLYAPRSQNTEPSGRDPGPLDFNFNDKRRAGPMGYDVPKGEMGDCQGNWQIVNDPAATVLHSIEQTNRRFGKR